MSVPAFSLHTGVAPAQLSARVQAAVQRALDERRLVGAVVLVARDGALIHRQAAGWADRESGRTMAADAVFRLASVTKPIVSTAALVLVAQEGSAWTTASSAGCLSSGRCCLTASLRGSPYGNSSAIRPGWATDSSRPMPTAPMRGPAYRTAWMRPVSAWRRTCAASPACRCCTSLARAGATRWRPTCWAP